MMQVTWMCNVRPEDKCSAEELRNVRECVQDRRLQWFGHLERIKESAWSSKCRTFKVRGSLPRGRPRKIWNEVIRSDLKEREVSKDIAKDRNVWESFIRNCPTHTNMQNKR